MRGCDFAVVEAQFFGESLDRGGAFFGIQGGTEELVRKKIGIRFPGPIPPWRSQDGAP